MAKKLSKSLHLEAADAEGFTAGRQMRWRQIVVMAILENRVLTCCVVNAPCWNKWTAM